MFLIGGTHTGNAAPIAPKAHDHTTIGSRCKKVVQNPAIIFDSFYGDSSSFFFCLCVLCCEEEVNLRTRVSLLHDVFFFSRDVQKEKFILRVRNHQKIFTLTNTFAPLLLAKAIHPSQLRVFILNAH